MTLNGQSSVWDDISNIVVEEIIKESRRTEFRIVSGKWSTIRGQKEKKNKKEKRISKGHGVIVIREEKPPKIW